MICAIDTETTGLNETCCEMIELAIVGLNKDFSFNGHCYTTRIRPSPIALQLMSPEAFEIHRITKEELLMAPTAAQVRTSLLIWKRELTDEKIFPLGHNYIFDRTYIRKFMGIELYDETFDYHIRDTTNLITAITDMGSHIPRNLRKACAHFNIPTQDVHDAEGDARLTAILYKTLIGLIKLV